jgi:hypothetical protein
VSNPCSQLSHREPSLKQRTRQLVSQREDIMAEIALRTRLGAVTPVITKIRTLLTRFWAAANWSERAELLSVARWLLQLDVAQIALVQHKMARSKRRPRKGQAFDLVR